LLIKDLPVPLWLIQAEALKKRIIPGHYRLPEIEKDLAKIKAGYKGELILRYYIKQLPNEKYYIFHDLQLTHNGVHFQIDTLLISRYYILIIEAKNIKGTVIFDNVFNQLIRINSDGTEDTFEDPRIQVKRLRKLLGGFLAENGLNFLPIDHLVFFSSTKTILKTNTNDYGSLEMVCKGRDLFNKIERLEKKYTHPRVNDEITLEMANFLLRNHSPMKIDILKEYSLTRMDLRTGVCCPKCLHIPMTYYKRRKWICPVCDYISKEAFIDGVRDYFLLINPTISNSECRNFLHIPTIDTAQKLLFQLNLPTSGTKKGRIYFPYSVEFPVSAEKTSLKLDKKVPHEFPNKKQ
jgi:hypothetical protein